MCGGLLRLRRVLGLMYMPDPQKAIREFYRVLRPGGRAVAAVWGERRKCGWAEIFPIVDSRVQSEVCPMFFNLGTGCVLSQLFGAAGFREIDTRRRESRLRYQTTEEACEAAFAGGPVALAYSRFSQDKKHTRNIWLRSNLIGRTRAIPYRESSSSSSV